jgi:hypothetical protein
LNLLKEKDNKLYSNLCSLSLNVKKKTRELNLDYRLLEKKKHSASILIAGIAGLIITFPLFLYGNIFNLTFLELPNMQIRKIKDPQFHSSIRYGLSLALAFVFLPVYFVLCLLLFHPLWLGMIVFLTLPLSGLFAWNYSLFFRRILGGFRIRSLIRKKDQKFISLKKSFSEIINITAGLKDEK